MSNYLKTLSEIAAPELIEFDRDSLVQEIIDRIKSNPEWESIYDGELLQNFLYSIINTFAFLFSKNSETVNRLIRETFITQAKDTKSIANHLSRFGINFKQNTASVVPITITNSNGGGFTRSFILPAGYQITGVDLNGAQNTFELYNKDQTDPSKYDYRSSLVVETVGQKILNAYSGETTRYDFTINPVSQREKFVYKIRATDIIEGSIRGYYEFNQSNERELIETNSFVVSAVDPDVNFPGGTPHYKIKYNDDGSADIIFGTQSFGGSFPSAFSSNIKFFCRSGGGAITNIAPFAINTTDTITISSSNEVTVLFRNLTSGSGGSDRENINEAKFYSPYRTGRDGSLVDDTDILNELANRTVKHLVNSPKYADISTGQKIPILHYWNYIAPIRDFSSFSFPIPVEADTIATYSVKLETALNEFLNLQGIHDGVESNKLISLFSEGPITFQIPKTPVLNGTLFVSAFGENNVEKDRLIFSGNYSGAVNAAADYTSYAEIATTNPITTAVTIISGNNDQLRFKIDQSSPGPAPVTESFTITIAEGVYGLTLGKSLALAAEIDAKIKAAFPTYYGTFSDEICYIRSDGRLAIRSRITGQYSSVKIFSIGGGIQATIGLPVSYAYATPENGRVLLASSVFNNDTSQLTLNINRTRFDRNFNLAPNIIWPAANSDIGPTLTYTLLDDGDATYLVQEGTDLIVEAYNGSTLTDTLTFASVSSDSPNVGSGDPTGSVAVFDDTTATSCLFDFATNTLSLKLSNSNDAGPTYSYPKFLDQLGTPDVYNQNTVFKIYTKEKTYKFITVTYEPNPYFNETEAAEVLSVLKAKGKRSLALEPLVKKVNFIPLKIEVDARPAKGISGEEIIVNSEDILYASLEYSNKDSRNNIGTGFSKTRAESLLNDKTNNRGVDFANITTPANAITDSDGNDYYFLLPRSFITQMEALEDDNPNINGLSDSYKVKINIV